MIFLALALGQAVAQAPVAALESLRLETKRYYACAQNQAKKLEPSRDAANLIVTAAITLCASERERVADVAAVDLILREPKLSTSQISSRTDRFLTVLDADVAKKTLPIVLEQRAARK